MKSITVFCGSSLGTESEFEKEALRLGETLAKQNIKLVYGGAKIGLMGAVAKSTLHYGGSAVGVIPTFLQKKEVVHEELSKLIVVETMHERKQKMFDLCDGFIALPGGMGTLEELFEILTWAQLGRHKKPIGILNTNGYYNQLIGFLESAISKEFIRENNMQLLVISSDIEDLLTKMHNYIPPPLPRWMNDEQV